MVMEPVSSIQIRLEAPAAMEEMAVKAVELLLQSLLAAAETATGLAAASAAARSLELKLDKLKA
jgi:hypothetical protein